MKGSFLGRTITIFTKKIKKRIISYLFIFKNL
jgi:hypothetical protein